MAGVTAERTGVSRQAALNDKQGLYIVGGVFPIQVGMKRVAEPLSELKSAI